MALPNDPIALAEAMDPAEVLDFVFDLSAVLEVGEVIDTYTLTMSAEGAALGVTIQTGLRQPRLIEESRALQVWFGVAPGFLEDGAFARDGTRVGIELRAVTTATPTRTRERTFALTVQQR